MKRLLLTCLLCVVLLCVVFSFAGCDKNAATEANGYYVNIEKEGNNSIVEVVCAQNGAYTFTTFTVKDSALSVSDLRADVLSSYTQNGSYANASDAAVKTGTYEYVNNAFIIQRLSVTYSDGKTEKCYLDFSDKSFELSPSIGSVFLYALIGIVITFLVLMFLMGVIKLLSFSVEKITQKKQNKQPQTDVNADADATSDVNPIVAKGSAGELVLRGISDKDAALVMAIVADELQAPLNTLRFISITDVTPSEDKK